MTDGVDLRSLLERVQNDLGKVLIITRYVAEADILRRDLRQWDDEWTVHPLSATARGNRYDTIIVTFKPWVKQEMEGERKFEDRLALETQVLTDHWSLCHRQFGSHFINMTYEQVVELKERTTPW